MYLSTLHIKYINSFLLFPFKGTKWLKLHQIKMLFHAKPQKTSTLSRDWTKKQIPPNVSSRKINFDRCNSDYVGGKCYLPSSSKILKIPSSSAWLMLPSLLASSVSKILLITSAIVILGWISWEAGKLTTQENNGGFHQLLRYDIYWGKKKAFQLK